MASIPSRRSPAQDPSLVLVEADDAAVRCLLAVGCLLVPWTGDASEMNAYTATEVALHARPIRTRVSGEVVALANNERMGLAGLHEDLFLGSEHRGLYLGVGGYGAAAGHRGGFFILGGSLGWVQPLTSRMGLDVGGFAGGGGGTRDSGQGDGLMLRGHAVATWAFTGWNARAGIATIDFPGGTIRSTAFTTGFTLTDALTLLGPGSATTATPALTTQQWGFSPILSRYWLDDDTEPRPGQSIGDHLDLVGIELCRVFTHHWSLPFQLGGALGGSRAGYMEAFAGPAYTIGETYFAEARALAGLGGGGSFDTGGGILFRPEIGVGYRFSADSSVLIRGGRVMSLDGDFSGYSTTFALRWDPANWHLPSHPTSHTAAVPTDGYRVDAWRVSMGNTTYLVQNPDRPHIQLVDVAIEKPLTPWFNFVGRTRSAYAGDAGSYSEGYFGARVSWHCLPALTIGCEMAGGAGGGGGLPTGNGLIASGQGDLRFQWTSQIYASLAVGRTFALDDDFYANSLSFGIGWGFARALLPH